MSVEIKRVDQLSELTGIRDLQALNLRKNIDAETALSQGFLTAAYTMDYLQAMHDASPSIIAKDGDDVVGYALVATKEVRNGHDLMADLFNVIDTKYYKGKCLQKITGVRA